MKIRAIEAQKENIVLKLEGADNEVLHVNAHVPLVCGTEDPNFIPGRMVADYEAAVKEGEAVLPRYAGEYDLLLCRFEAFSPDKVEGVCYVTEVAEELPVSHEPYPILPIKAISSGALMEDFDELGFSQTCFSPNQAELMLMHPGENALPYLYNGRTYYFNKEVLEKTEKNIVPLAEKGIPAVMRYINSSFFIGERSDQEIVDIIQHPGYDYDYPSAYMGAFNLRTEEGFNYFCACTDFLLARYTRQDHKYGWAISFEVGNEVTSQYIWGNAGEMTCGEYMREYTEIMRICWLLSQKYWSNFRVHTSFDQYFKGSHMPSEPKRFYGIKECVDEILRNCQEDGDFPWNIAFHPYPENLSYPDFWNDREPNWTFETRRITFKNLEVMPAYLAQTHLLYKGKPRRIILPEQGFNSRSDAPYTEKQGMYGYVLAYQKMKKLGTIDLFLHHNYVDNPGEFGLNLGIRRYGGDKYPSEGLDVIGERKPICSAIADMDTEREAERVAEARAFIGEELYDYILNPPPVTEKLETGDGGLHLPGQGNRKGKKDGQSAPVSNFDH